ncbi:Dephospho-CoA kinase [Flavobacterium sp. CECT 9288]|uniref:dephospho-CoA kinase n=1 Tax=Flavobacterium sp. CECT 9288 TaxID=2845819 RepID=UPI001E37E779|nr:dephospho-CoA kinase [Flavobacterium sp. CECT 9288]CAH0335613.1 Dephospho-CoA kinase [Flavobacterium sp. CECT 9288]
MTKIIGLTGGIGSGKTTIAGFFKTAGIPVFIADDAGKKVMQDEKVLNSIKEVFGALVFKGGILDRAELAKIVFSDPEKLQVLNKIVHPAIKQDFELWLKQNDKAQYVIYEAAILFESDKYKDCDVIISVVAPLETRINRVLERDATTRDHVLKRINAQWTDAQRVEKSDFVIENISLESSKQEVDKILKILKIKQKEA